MTISDDNVKQTLLMEPLTNLLTNENDPDISFTCVPYDRL